MTQTAERFTPVHSSCVARRAPQWRRRGFSWRWRETWRTVRAATAHVTFLRLPTEGPVLSCSTTSCAVEPRTPG